MDGNTFRIEGTNNKAILFCHGLGGNTEHFYEMGKHFNTLGYTVYCPLYRGHNTTKEAFLSTDVDIWYIDLIHAYLELEDNYQEVFIIGVSMGGALTVKLAELFKPKAIVTINAGIIGLDIDTDLANAKAKLTDDEYEKYAKQRTLYNKRMIEIGQTEALRNLTCPILVCQGEKDSVRYKISSAMLMNLTNSTDRKRINYAKSGHLIMFEPDREQLLQDIEEFIIRFT